MKKISYVLIIRIAAIVLLLAALIAACLGSFQSTLPFLLPIEFQGEYRLYNEETQNRLSPDFNIPAECGGRLTIDSAPWKGTTAVIYIPKEGS